jgi:hypothetical protein
MADVSASSPGMSAISFKDLISSPAVIAGTLGLYSPEAVAS